MAVNIISGDPLPVDSIGAAIDEQIAEIVRNIAGWDKNTTDDLICRLDEGAVSAHTKAILALLAQEVNKAVLKAEIKARTDTMRIYNKSLKDIK